MSHRYRSLSEILLPLHLVCRLDENWYQHLRHYRWRRQFLIFEAGTLPYFDKNYRTHLTGSIWKAFVGWGDVCNVLSWPPGIISAYISWALAFMGKNMGLLTIFLLLQNHQNPFGKCLCGDRQEPLPNPGVILWYNSLKPTVQNYYSGV